MQQLQPLLMAILGSLFLVNGKLREGGRITMKQYMKLSNRRSVEPTSPAKHLELPLSDFQIFGTLSCRLAVVVPPEVLPRSLPTSSSGTSSTVSMRRPLVVPDGVVSSEVGLGAVGWWMRSGWMACLSIYLSMYLSIHPFI